MRPSAGADAPLLAATGAGEQKAPVLVDVREYELGIRGEVVVHPVAVMGVDIHIRDPGQAVLGAEKLHQHADVVEHAKTRGFVPAGMMQPGDGHEGPAHGSFRHQRTGLEGRTDDGRGMLENPGKRRRVPLVEKAVAQDGHLLHEPDVLRGMEQLQLPAAGQPRRLENHPAVQAGFLEAPNENVVPVLAERMAVTEAVLGDFIAHHDPRLGFSPLSEHSPSSPAEPN